MLVIGAGITGAMIADALAPPGVKVAVVDKRGLAKGSTIASTALVQYEIDTPLIMLARKIGKEKAGRAWRRSRLAVEALAAGSSESASPTSRAATRSISPAMYWTRRDSARAQARRATACRAVSSIARRCANGSALLGPRP